MIIGKSKKYAGTEDAVSDGIKHVICVILFIAASLNLHLLSWEVTYLVHFSDVKLAARMPSQDGSVSSSFALGTQGESWRPCH